jgi:hypothetical protein
VRRRMSLVLCTVLLTGFAPAPFTKHERRSGTAERIDRCINRDRVGSLKKGMRLAGVSGLIGLPPGDYRTRTSARVLVNYACLPNTFLPTVFKEWSGDKGTLYVVFSDGEATSWGFAEPHVQGEEKGDRALK